MAIDPYRTHLTKLSVGSSDERTTVVTSGESLFETYGTCAIANGTSGVRSDVTQAIGTALTGNLRGAYFVATNGTTAATGTIRGIECKARAADSSNVGANVTTLEGAYLNADPKNKNVTTMRGTQIVLDGAAGGTVTTAVGLEINNNSSGVQTTAYGISLNEGSSSGKHTYNYDIRFQTGALVDNATSGKLNFLTTYYYFTCASRASSDYAYGYTIDGSDDMLTGGDAQKSYLLYLTASRPVTAAATGDSNDALLRANFNNYAANDANFITRGINVSMGNRSGGVMGYLEGGALGVNNRSGSTSSNVSGLTVTVENYGTVSDRFGGIDILMKNEGAVATTEYGLRIRNENNSIGDSVGAAIKITDTGANTGFDYWLDCYGATAATVAPIRLGQTGGEDIVIAMGDFADGADSGFAPGSIGLDTTNGLLFVTDSAGLWQQVTV